MDGGTNVIVTDGFTGNVALKTAEGTANFITSELKNALSGNFIGKFSSFLNISNLKKFKRHYPNWRQMYSTKKIINELIKKFKY